MTINCLICDEHISAGEYLYAQRTSTLTCFYCAAAKQELGGVNLLAARVREVSIAARVAAKLNPPPEYRYPGEVTIGVPYIQLSTEEV